MPLEMNMIYQRAHHYARLTGAALEDLVQEGVLASLEAEKNFDASRGTKLTTWQWWQIERRLRHFCFSAGASLLKHSIPMEDLDPTQEPTQHVDGVERVEFADQLSWAPPDVKIICCRILTRPEHYAGLDPRKCWCMIREELTHPPKPGWSLLRANEAIQDCKVWFRNIPETLRRTLSGDLRRTLWPKI